MDNNKDITKLCKTQLDAEPDKAIACNTEVVPSNKKSICTLTTYNTNNYKVSHVDHKSTINHDCSCIFQCNLPCYVPFAEEEVITKKYGSNWLNKIKSIASNIISNIKIRQRISIRPFPIENIDKNIAKTEGSNKQYYSNKLDEYRLSVSILNKKMHDNELSELKCEQSKIDDYINENEGILYPYISSESWKPPSIHGLENSPRIIPDYYISTCMNQDTNILRIDYKFTILDDIRNLRKLSKYQIKYIKNLSSEDKQEILEEYNRVIESFLSIL